MIASRVASTLINENPFGWLIAVYFFIAAIGTGTMLFTMVVQIFRLKQFKGLARLTAFVNPVVAAAMGLFLILELAQPLRFWRVMVSFNPTSPISWGSWVLLLFGSVAVLYAYAEWKGIETWKPSLARVGIVAALLVPVYTSFELLMTRSSPLWTSALLPVTYVSSALIAGVAVVLLLGALTSFWTDTLSIHTLGRVGAYLLVAAGSLVLIQVAVLFSRSPQAVIIGQNLLFGSYRAGFWGLVMVGGILIPTALLYVPSLARQRVWQVAASLLILAGIFSQRALEIFAGMSYLH